MTPSRRKTTQLRSPDDYVCVQCANVLAEAMHSLQMTKKVRVGCGRCSTVNVAVTDESENAAGRPV